MPQVTISDLFAEIGQLTMEKKALERENAALKDALSDNRKEVEDVPSTIPSPVSGPDNDA